MSSRYIVIMAGGRGERFWPESRLSRPKHLLPIVGDKPMLTQTIDRIGSLVPVENILIITNVEQRNAVLEICPALPPENIIAEPVGRDTAAAVGLATVLVQRKNPEASFAMLPADHVIHDAEGFQRILNLSFEAAEKEDALVTVGIKASYPATGYGYIKKAEPVLKLEGKPIYSVSAFKEKPDEAIAKEYVSSGDHFWNAGMFFWRVDVIASAFEKLTPGLWKALERIKTDLDRGESMGKILSEQYPKLEKISIDYAIMEKAAKVLVIESDFDWDDVGEWPALERHLKKDSSENVTRGVSEFLESKGNIIYNNGKRLTALVGCENLIVVETDGATLICSKDKAQDIKKLVKKLGENPDYQSLL